MDDREISSSEKYITEVIRLQSWNNFIKCSINSINDLLKIKCDKKIIKNIINYNTFVIGCDKLNEYVLLPNTDNLIKYQDILMDELSYTLEKNIDTFKADIMKIIINCNEQSKMEMKSILANTKFYKINVDVKINKNKVKLLIIDDKYPNTFTLPINHYNRLKQMFNGTETQKKYINLWICILLLRYRYYTFIKEGISLSVDIIYQFIKTNNYTNISLEAFAGALNSDLPNYCSLFYDIEKYFGSKGSFLLINPDCKYEIIISNPPYIDIIIKQAAIKLINFLNRCNDIFIIVIIPDWRSVDEFKQDINIQKDINGLPQKRVDISYIGYSILRNSKYFRDVFFIGDFKYYNFFKDEKRSINGNILILLLSKIPSNIYYNKMKNYLNKIIQPS